MKKLCFLLIFLMGLSGCGGGTGDTGGQSTSGPRVLVENQTVTDNIAVEGEVDWYRFNAVEVNRTLAIHCTGSYHNAPVDFMMTVYERDGNGNLVPLFGKCAAEGAALPADLEVLVRIDHPKQLYIAVRDFMDDDASSQTPYRIELHYTEAATDTGTFAQAQNLEVDAGVCQADSISEIGEVNTYRFDIVTEGAYRLSARYDVSNPATVAVNLGIELYDEDGQLIYQYKEGRPQDLTYAVIVHLIPGTYYVVVDDQGRNNTDAANYTICVDTADATELAQNDSQASAQANAPGAEGYNLDGILEYLQDQDWYVITVPEASGISFQNLILEFARDMETLPASISRLTNPGSYQITVLDGVGNVLLEHDHPVTSSSTYSVQLAAGQGEQHYILVRPVIEGQMVAALPYQLRVALVEVTDENENGDAVTTLNPAGETVTGKISTMGDVDNFQLTVDTTSAPKVLELAFDTTEASMVDYSLHVMWNGIHKILKDVNGTDNGTDEGDHFKSSFYLPQTSGQGTTVTLQVSDDQNNDGSNAQYALQVGVLDMPTGSLATVPGIVDTTPVYHSEPGERADGAALDVTVVEYDSYDQPVFKANTSLLRVDALDANNQWQSDWIGGFVDYDGDRDLFQLNFDDITGAVDAPENWYFDIQVQFYAAAGSVEYGWSLFRDGQPNGVLLERTFWQETDGEVFEYNIDAEGVIACWADMETTSEIQNITVPRAEDGPFWIGHRWGDSRFYLSIQDFNRAVESRVYNTTLERWDPIPNQIPDNDWGNTNSSPAVPPYYFRVTVTFHPDCSSPTECD